MSKQMVDLINSFPVMQRRSPGTRIKEWDGNYITRQDGLKPFYDSLCTSERAVVEFALSIWNINTDWQEFGFAPFNLARAFATWDEGQRKAFLAWAKEPFFR